MAAFQAAQSAPPRGGPVPKKKREERLRHFSSRNWLHLVASSNGCSVPVKESTSTSTTREGRRATRAETLVALRKVPACRQAWEGAEVAPDTLRKFEALTDPRRRPADPRKPVSQELVDVMSGTLLKLYEKCLRSSEKSGMTGEHLIPLLRPSVTRRGSLYLLQRSCKAECHEECCTHFAWAVSQHCRDHVGA